MVDPLSENATSDLVESPAAGKANDITRFFQGIEKKDHSSRNEVFESQNPSLPLTVDVTTYSPDYKPETSENKKYVYSINELLSFSKQPASESIQDVINSLPKKKFWRFGRRFSDHTTHKNPSHKSGNRSPNPNPKNKVSAAEEGLFERRNSKTKSSRTPHAKKGSKFGKNDRYMEEKDIAVNNDDLLALEEDFEPTGNSMADFESWKAKMKEMDRKKRGLTESKIEAQDNKISLSSTSSSISDFLNLNSRNQEAETSNLDRSEGPEKKYFEDDKLEKQSESLKGASRFSSFFTQSSSSVSLPSNNTNINPTEQDSVRDTKRPLEPNNSGSRLMSFFNADAQKAKEEKPAALPNKGGNPHIGQTYVQPRSLQVTLPEQQTLPSNHPPTGQKVPAPQSQTNSNFFQGLLNRGKASDQGPMPPAEMTMPPGVRRMPQPPQSQLAQQGQMTIPPGFPMGIPPAGFPPSFQGRAQVPQYIVKDSSINYNNSKSSNANGKPSTRQLQNQPPPGVLPLAPGMIPPGFPPLQGMPPNFNPSMYGPPNGMMQPNGQQFYPPMPPPPGGNLNFSPYQIPSIPKQQESRQR